MQEAVFFSLINMLFFVLSWWSVASSLETFEEFKRAFGKKYSSRDEESRRAEIFGDKLNEIRAHNSLQKGWTMGINQFSDMTFEEFSETILMNPQNCSATTTPQKTRRRQLHDLPDSIDWRDRGVVSEVKNQGHCGSCWTFSTVGALESHLAIKSDNWRAPRLSEQQLVDCATDFDTNGCDGGLPSHAFEYVKYAGGLSTEFSYPYKGVDGNCSFDASSTEQVVPMADGVGIVVPGGSVNLTAGDEDELLYTIATVGPVSVAFQVASDFQNYKSGVYSSSVCQSGFQDVNHAVLAVGYGTDSDGKPYWIVKNSWDYSWGDYGYFKIEAFQNMCGIANCNSYPDLYGQQEEGMSSTL